MPTLGDMFINPKETEGLRRTPVPQPVSQLLVSQGAGDSLTGGSYIKWPGDVGFNSMMSQFLPETECFNQFFSTWFSYLSFGAKNGNQSGEKLVE